MTLRRLKSIRIALSILFFGLIAFLFLDFRDIGASSIAGKVLYLQFVPSLLKFLHATALGATGFIVVLTITVLFGRVYCSTICPLGTLQDVIAFIFRRPRKRRSYRHSKAHNVLRYTIFAITVVVLLAGSGILLNLLDPFSIFGRIFSNLVRPVVLAANNVAAMGLEKAGSHLLFRERWAAIAPLSIGVSIAMLALIAVFAARYGRLYCNTICPVGALLGLVSRISLFRIRFAKNACNRCKLCERVCKAGCIDIQRQTIDSSRCVGCYNCLATCPRQALQFENKWRRSIAGQRPENGRRGFILGMAAGVAGLTLKANGQSTPTQSRPTKIPEQVTSPTSPPGSSSIARFKATCTACHLCVSACPSRVIVPSVSAYGFSGIMQPRMNFRSGYCNYECTICTQVCPSGALLPLTVEKKKSIQLGVAKFIKENCIVYTDNTNCGACSEHCPTKAVNMVPYLTTANKRLVIPEVNPDICVGCGACEHACPTTPYKAIYVDGNPVHKPAQKPVEKVIDEKVDDKEDFPF